MTDSLTTLGLDTSDPFLVLPGDPRVPVLIWPVVPLLIMMMVVIVVDYESFGSSRTVRVN